MRWMPLVLILAACAGDDGVDTDTDTDVVVDTDTDVGGTDTDTDVAAVCDGEALCTRTIDDCGTELTLDQCLSFYDPETTSCADLDGYLACNCDCITEATCDDYFGCGEICFADHCGG